MLIESFYKDTENPEGGYLFKRTMGIMGKQYTFFPNNGRNTGWLFPKGSFRHTYKDDATHFSSFKQALMYLWDKERGTGAEDQTNWFFEGNDGRTICIGTGERKPNAD